LPTHRRRAALAAVLAATLAPATAGADTGPSTTTPPYLVPSAEGVSLTSLLTVGDGGAAADGYALDGVPDGLGAYSIGDGEFGLLANHELEADDAGTPLGVPRAHGLAGAFVSRFRVDRDTLAVRRGEDFIQPGTDYYDYEAKTWGPAPGGAFTPWFLRFCSSTLTSTGQLFHEDTGRGYEGRLYFANEETGDDGRTFGVTEDGHARQLPRLGLHSWENTVPADNRRSDTTLVMGQEDRSSDTGPVSQIWIYVGRKTAGGDAFERAGLTNGRLYVADVADQAVSTDAQFRGAYGKGQAVDVALAEVDWDQSGEAQNAEGAAKGLSLTRIEDGVWDPRPGHKDDFYFTTTEGGAGATDERDGGGVWRLRFEDRDDSAAGATLELLLDGSELPLLHKPDNLALDRHGNLLVQEDPGADPQAARVVAYDVDTGAIGVVAQFDPLRFTAGAPGFITDDEESSGIIDAERWLGRGWFLLDAQVHVPSGDPKTVELGQLLALRVRDFEDVYRH
jgi:hypothetical protein